jgi:hypothetical protein
MKYVANPVEVDAYVIKAVKKYLGDDNHYLTLAEIEKEVTATPAMTSRMLPVPGDYWVIQADGYEYINPKAVFERKYRPDPTVVEAKEIS